MSDELSRQPESLAEKCFDLVVIGGGIAGAGCAWDAALRGLKTALLEKSDFGGATSAGCFKIVHGGLRYLQNLDFKRVITSSQEQAILASAAPHLVQPFPFLIPTRGGLQNNKLLLKAALATYESLAATGKWFGGVPNLLPRHQVLSPSECLTKAPGVLNKGLSGAIVYYDCQMTSAERLTYAVVRSAAAAGASVCNYVEVIDLKANPEGDSPKETVKLFVKDSLSGRVFSLLTRCVVNAAGPWAKTLETKCNIRADSGPELFSKGIQLVIKGTLSELGVALESKYRDNSSSVVRRNRSWFLQPWRGHTLIGTTDTPWRGDPDEFEISEEDIIHILLDVAQVYSSTHIDRSRVLLAFGGLRPVNRQAAKDFKANGSLSDWGAGAALEDEISQHSIAGTDCAWITVSAAKYTTFRRLAEKVLDLVCSKLGKTDCPSLTKGATIYGGEVGQIHDAIKSAQRHCPQLSASTLTHLVSHYGSHTDEILRIIDKNPELSQPVFPGTEVLLAELVFTSRNETIGSLGDIVFRRTGLGTVGLPEQSTIKQISALVSGELGWNGNRREQEEAQVVARSGHGVFPVGVLTGAEEV